MYKHFFKRFFDFWIALVGLVCISPILVAVTIWLHFANKGAGALFFQEGRKNLQDYQVQDDDGREGQGRPSVARCRPSD